MSKLDAFATEKTVLSREAQQRGFLWVLLKTVPPRERFENGVSDV
jgi:hypothetical protein